ncbi:MAG: aspartate-semialdehyde dehydrogenase [Deltaproteobacteria bacterium]|nr:aspartate-semialdehyde dehydrogenase [Deltaproteobacteria bacterium]
MSKKKFNIAVAGATGAVGNQMLTCLEERDFPVKSIKLLASRRSVGRNLRFRGDMDIALFSAGGTPSKKYAPLAAKDGCVVVDNSSTWRMDTKVPLVVPEVNPHAIAGYTQKGIIANPNCSTIQMVLPINPIHKKYEIKRIVVSTYQAVSGTGKKAIDELFDQTRSMINFLDYEKKVYPHRIAFNCIPHIDVFMDNGYTKEEIKMVNETRKILEDDNIGITATTVRVPVYFGHSESVNIETKKEISAGEVRYLLEKEPGIKVLDKPEQNIYPLAVDAAGQDLTLVGRIRDDESVKNGINIWIVADNIRKGAATNAVQIAEILAKDYLSGV